MVMLKAVPWRLVGYAVAAVLALAALNHFASFIPFTPQWSAKRAAASVDRLEGEVSTLERTAEGNAQIGQAVETYHTREVVIREVAAQAVTENRNAEDASTPLPPERIARLHAHDRLLCERTGLCSLADVADGGEEAVRGLDPAGPAG